MSISNKSCELDMEGDNKMLASPSGITPAENYQPILLDFPSVLRILIYTHTHTHTHIYIYIYVFNSYLNWFPPFS
jgi:hypothetical protein